VTINIDLGVSRGAKMYTYLIHTLCENKILRKWRRQVSSGIKLNEKYALNSLLFADQISTWL
jgi:hypothetical protein